MLVESVGLSLAVGKLRKGKISNFKDTILNKWYFFIAAFALEFATVFLASKNVSFFRDYILIIHLFSYLILFAGIYFNRTSLAFKLIFIGIFLNFMVIMLNGGQMPVSVEAMQRAGLDKGLQIIADNRVVTHSIVDENTRLAFLGDVISLKKPYPRPKVFSIGDIFIAFGVFFFIQKNMVLDKQYKIRQP